MTTALIDADEVVFKSVVIKSSEMFDDEVEGRTVRPPTEDEVIARAVEIIESWRREVKADEILLCWSPDDRKLFRRGLAAYYKSTRGEKPEHFWAVVDYLKWNFDGESEPGLEADDVMGILQTKKTIIVSSDKDMKTVPGKLYSPRTRKFSAITPERADWQWMHQTLTGDTVDDYPGRRGIGPTKASAILGGGTSLKTWWPAVVEAFRSAWDKKTNAPVYPDPVATAREQASLARILRPSDYSRETGQVRYSFNTKDHIAFHAATIAR